MVVWGENSFSCSPGLAPKTFPSKAQKKQEGDTAVAARAYYGQFSAMTRLGQLAGYLVVVVGNCKIRLRASAATIH